MFQLQSPLHVLLLIILLCWVVSHLIRENYVTLQLPPSWTAEKIASRPYLTRYW